MTGTGEAPMIQDQDDLPRPRRRVWRSWLGLVLVATIASDVAAQAPRTRRDVIQPAVQPAVQPVVQTDLPRYPPTSQQLASVEISAELDRQLHRLTSTSYAEREAATAELLSSNRITNDEMYAALDRHELTAEQRHRLLLIVRDRVLSKPRGAVGIRVDRRFWPDQIVIQELLPDLPARRVLEIGDRITHVEGEPLVSWDAFVRAVQLRPPGSKVSITIERSISARKPRRDARVAAQAPAETKVETLNLELELGSADKLKDPNTGQPSQAGPVLTERQGEADQALRTWGPKPKQVEVR